MYNTELYTRSLFSNRIERSTAVLTCVQGFPYVIFYGSFFPLKRERDSEGKRERESARGEEAERERGRYSRNI
jgi:hypothetical protein